MVEAQSRWRRRHHLRGQARLPRERASQSALEFMQVRFELDGPSTPPSPSPLLPSYHPITSINMTIEAQAEATASSSSSGAPTLSTSDSALLKHELAYVLGQMQDARAIPTLTKVLEDGEEHAMVRHEAAEAMGAIADPVALPILEKYREDKDVSVRETCELAIRKIQYEVGGSGAQKASKKDAEK